MFSTPAHKQVDPSKLPAQRVLPSRIVEGAVLAAGGGVRHSFNEQRAELIAAERAAAKRDVLADIIAHEQGELDEDATIELFQRLIDSGLVWQLQGSYGRVATQMIHAGLCTRA